MPAAMFLGGKVVTIRLDEERLEHKKKHMAVGQNLRYLFCRVPYHLFKRLKVTGAGVQGFDQYKNGLRKVNTRGYIFVLFGLLVSTKRPIT